jgi:hypothetical protein
MKAPLHREELSPLSPAYDDRNALRRCDIESRAQVTVADVHDAEALADAGNLGKCEAATHGESLRVE